MVILTGGLQVCTNNQKPEFNNPDLKWGIAYAINQDQLIEATQGGSGQTSGRSILTMQA